MATTEPKIKKRGMTTIKKTVTKGVNAQGKKFRTVEKTASNPLMDKSATTTKTRTGGLFGKTSKYGSSTENGKPKMFKQGPTTILERQEIQNGEPVKKYYEVLSGKRSYKAAKGEQKNMVKSGKKQAKFLKETSKSRGKKIAMKKELIMKRQRDLIPFYATEMAPFMEIGQEKIQSKKIQPR